MVKGRGTEWEEGGEGKDSEWKVEGERVVKTEEGPL